MLPGRILCRHDDFWTAMVSLRKCTLVHSMIVQTYCTCTHPCLLRLSSCAYLDLPRNEAPTLVCQAPTTDLSSSFLSNCKRNWNCTCACNVLQVEATNELGDVHAHFGSWPEAVQAWHDALDCIIGPYQVNLLALCCLATCPCYFSRS